MKRIIWSCVGLALGALFVVGAVFGMTSDEVTCGGEKMQEGDVCVSKSRGGLTTENTLEESRTNAKIGASVGIAMGAVTLFFSGWNLLIGVRRKNQAVAGVPPQTWQPQHPTPYPAPQYQQPTPQYPAPQHPGPQHPAPQYQQPGPPPQQQPSWHNQNWT